MVNHLARASGSDYEWDPRIEIADAYLCIRRICATSGLSPSDADDIAQEILLWLLRNRDSVRVLTMSWLRGVARNFIRRHNRARAVRICRELTASREAEVLFGDVDESLELRLSLDRLEETLPPTEAELLRRVRDGFTFAQAVANLGIPRGSRSFFRKRLIGHLAVALQADENLLERKSISHSADGRRREMWMAATQPGSVCGRAETGIPRFARDATGPRRPVAKKR